MKCRCGFENLADAQFCARCGSPIQVTLGLKSETSSDLTVPAATATALKPAKPKLNFVRVVLGIAVVVMATVAYWWSNRPEADYIYEESGLYEVNVNGKLGFIDKTGTLIIQPAYDSEYGSVHSFNEGLAPVRIQGKWGYIDTHGVMVIQPQFDAAHWFVNGAAPVQIGSGSNARWGFIGKDGKYVVNPQFSGASYFQDGLAPVNVNGVMGFVNKSGELIIKPRFRSALIFSEGLAPVSESGNWWGYINKSGEYLVKPQFELANSFSEGVALVRSGGKYGYIDHSGKFVINPQFDVADSFKDGFAIVGIADKKGTIEKSGKFLLNPGQVNIQNIFVRGVALPARSGNGIGYVDKDGAWVISPTSIIETANGMRGDIAGVRIAGEECYINSRGTVIWGAPKGKSVYALEKEQQEKIQAAQVAQVAQAAQAAQLPPSVEQSSGAAKSEGATLKPTTMPKGDNAWDITLPSAAESYDYDPHISMSVSQKIIVRLQCFKQRPDGSYYALQPTEPPAACGRLGINSLPNGDAGSIDSAVTQDYATVCNRGPCTVRLQVVGSPEGRGNYFKVTMRRYDHY